MKLRTQIMLHKILSDMRTILTLIVLASVLSSVVSYGFGYLAGQSDTRTYFMALLGE